MSALAKQRHEQFLRENPRSVPRAMFMAHQGLKHAQSHLVAPHCVRYSFVASAVAACLVLMFVAHWIYHSLFDPDYYRLLPPEINNAT